MSAPADGSDWRAAYRELDQRALYRLLSIISGSPLADRLVLRGSMLLRAWLGGQAREPGDLDWVVRPGATPQMSTVDICAAVIDAVRSSPAVDGLPVLQADRATVRETWAYDRAPGRRLAIPWRSPGRLSGYAQLDVVAQGPLPDPPVRTVIPGLGDQPAVTVWSASPELSLAWKLLWLETDQYPKGKDLYDATLLAEYTTVPLELLRRTLYPELLGDTDDFGPDSVGQWEVNLDDPPNRYPGIGGLDWTWADRLTDALQRTFRPDPGPDRLTGPGWDRRPR
jgi:Nucleotidyl transferase AbiEii toxin, Type IV TA system